MGSGKFFGGLVEVIAIFAVIVMVMAFWTKWQQEQALAQAQLVKQAGYSNLEVNAGNAILNSIFNRN